MTIGILQCGDLPEPLRAEHGPYGAMVERLLGPGRHVTIHDVTAGDWPASATACEAFVLTGSSAGVYDDLPWIAELIAFLRQARGQARLVGICFGHQVMAEAFGGAVIKSPKGWGIGQQRYAVRHRADWMDAAAAITIPASHQDQVVTCPPDARVSLANDFTPFAGLDYGDAISFQGHPEFDAGFGIAMIEQRQERYGAMADAAIASYAEGNDCALVAGWIGRFLDTPAQRPEDRAR